MARIIALLGPDGVGKTSVIKGIMEKYENTETQVKSYHMFSKKENHNSKEIAVEPYQKECYNSFLSFFKLLYMIIRFNILILNIRVKNHKNSNILFLERYYYDTYVDPERFRVRRNNLILNLGLKLIPKVECVYFSAKPKEIHRRKQELTLKQITTHNKNYEDLVSKLDKSNIVDANSKVEKVITDFYKLIEVKKLRYVNYRGKGYQGFPYGNPRIIIRKGDRDGLDVYKPTSKIGKLKLFGIKLLLPVLSKEIGVDKKLFQPLFDQFGKYIKISIYTGTEGYYRKPTLKIMKKNGNVIGYAKIALTSQVEKLVDNEHKTLLKLKKLNLKKGYVPEVLFFNGKILVTSTMKGKLGSVKFLDCYKEFLEEIREKTEKNGKCLVHGDFAPWNIMLVNNKPFVYDWELATNDLIVYDKYYYDIITKIFFKNISSKNYMKTCLNTESLEDYLKSFIRNRIFLRLDDELLNIHKNLVEVCNEI